MRRFASALAAVLILVAAMVCSMTGAPSTLWPSGLFIQVEDRNPWTHLEFNEGNDSFQFAIVTDRTGGRRPGIFTKAVEKLNLLQPEFVMSVGDLIQGGTDEPGQWALEWSEFEYKLEELNMPFFFCAGNHDISNLPMSENWHRKFGRSYYWFRYRGVLFVVLNTEDTPNRERAYNISSEQQQWVRDVLGQNDDVRWTFVFMHKPTWVYADTDPVEAGWSGIEDALQGRPYTVFAGHRHNYGKFVRKGQDYYMLATTGGGSKLRGASQGEFDHFVWVTMKPDGPVVANLMLDGIQDKDIRTLPDPLAEREQQASGKPPR